MAFRIQKKWKTADNTSFEKCEGERKNRRLTMTDPNKQEVGTAPGFGAAISIGKRSVQGWVRRGRGKKKGGSYGKNQNAFVGDLYEIG